MLTNTALIFHFISSQQLIVGGCRVAGKLGISTIENIKCYLFVFCMYIYLNARHLTNLEGVWDLFP